MESWKSISIWLAASVAVVGMFCLPASIRQGLWTDELFSLMVARERPEIMLKLLAQVHPPYYDQPPLYFLILHPFTWIPHSAVALRIPSLVFAAFSLACWCVLARRWGMSPMLTGAMLIAITLHPTMRFQATNVRMYTLFLLEIMVLLAGIEASRREGRGWWLVLAAVATSIGMMFYTSFHAVAVVGGTACLAGALALKPARSGGTKMAEMRRGGAILSGAVCAGLLLGSLWFPAILRKREIFGGGAGEFHVPLMRQLSQVAMAMIGNIWAGVMLAAGWLFFALFGRLRAWLFTLFFFLGFLPFLFTVILTPPEHFVADRYFLFLPPWLFLIAGLGWESACGKFLRAGRGATLAAAIILLSPCLEYDQALRTTLFKPMPDWHAAARILENNARPDEGILTGGFMSGEAIEFAMANPKAFTFHHKIYELKPFYKMARRDDVVWHVNAGPLPEPFVRIIKDFFPYSISFEGRNLALIEIHSKKPFTLPWGGQSKFHPPQDKPGAPVGPSGSTNP